MVPEYFDALLEAFGQLVYSDLSSDPLLCVPLDQIQNGEGWQGSRQRGLSLYIAQLKTRAPCELSIELFKTGKPN